MDDSNIKASVNQPINQNAGVVEMQVTWVAASFISIFFRAGGRQPPVGQGHLINDVSRSYTMTHHSR